MRIAIVFEFGTINGGENSMLSIIDRLDRTEFEIVAIAPSDGRLPQALQDRSIPHVPLDVRGPDGRRVPPQQAAGRLRAAIEAAAPEIVHANSLSMGRLTGMIARESTIVCVAHLRDIIALSRRAMDDLNGNHCCIAVPAATREYHVAHGLDVKRTVVCYNGVDCLRFAPRSGNNLLQQLTGAGVDASFALTVGQIGLRKGQDVLAEAAVRVADQCPQLQFVLAGERYSAKSESILFDRNLTATFESAGLRHRLHRIGYRTDMEVVMNSADLLIHPAHQEPLGRVLLEAAASGLPIIATDVGGTSEILEDGHSARLVPAGNADRLAAAILEATFNGDQYANFACAARRRIEASFHIDQAVAALSRLWGSLRNPGGFR